jgi:predicted RNase H-like HicB family nuclease
MMRYLIMLEQTEAGFAVQVPDLAIVTHGDSIESARQSAIEAIQSNLEAYTQSALPVPEGKPLSQHLENPEFRDLLFTYVEVANPHHLIAA